MVTLKVSDRDFELLKLALSLAASWEESVLDTDNARRLRDLRERLLSIDAGVV